MRRLMILGVTTLLMTSTALAAVSLNSKDDKLSYAMGATTGMAFKTHNMPVNGAAFVQGVQDSMNGKKLLMNKAQIKASLDNYQKERMQQYQTAYKEQAGTNAKRSADFLAKNKTKDGIKTLPNGLQYKVIKAGTGTSPTLKDTVVVNYEGSLMDGKVFDSSYKRKQPATFPLQSVIKGWQVALTKMKAGATWELYVPPQLAYGKEGVPGLIGPNEALIFKVNLIKVKNS